MASEFQAKWLGVVFAWRTMSRRGLHYSSDTMSNAHVPTGGNALTEAFSQKGNETHVVSNAQYQIRQSDHNGDFCGRYSGGAESGAFSPVIKGRHSVIVLVPMCYKYCTPVSFSETCHSCLAASSLRASLRTCAFAGYPAISMKPFGP